MNKFADIKGIIFDYGGTIDTGGRHWAEVLWSKYVEFNIPVSKSEFRVAYVYGERTLAVTPLIKPEHNFYDVLFIKVGLQISYLIDNGFLKNAAVIVNEYPKRIAESCYNSVLDVLMTTRNVLEKLSMQYKLVLVSNFYGNIETILKDFNLLCPFKEIIESSVVGVRKPDPAIFELGVKALGFRPEEIIVVGDSFSKDMLPAKKVGCNVVWLKGEGWEEETDDSLPDAIITGLNQLPALLNNWN